MSVFKYHAFIFLMQPPRWRTEHYQQRKFNWYFPVIVAEIDHWTTINLCKIIILGSPSRARWMNRIGYPVRTGTHKIVFVSCGMYCCLFSGGPGRGRRRLHSVRLSRPGRQTHCLICLFLYYRSIFAAVWFILFHRKALVPSVFPQAPFRPGLRPGWSQNISSVVDYPSVLPYFLSVNSF